MKDESPEDSGPSDPSETGSESLESSRKSTDIRDKPRSSIDHRHSTDRRDKPRGSIDRRDKNRKSLDQPEKPRASVDQSDRPRKSIDRFVYVLFYVHFTFSCRFLTIEMLLYLLLTPASMWQLWRHDEVCQIVQYRLFHCSFRELNSNWRLASVSCGCICEFCSYKLFNWVFWVWLFRGYTDLNEGLCWFPKGNNYQFPTLIFSPWRYSFVRRTSAPAKQRGARFFSSCTYFVPLQFSFFLSFVTT